MLNVVFMGDTRMRIGLGLEHPDENNIITLDNCYKTSLTSFNK